MPCRREKRSGDFFKKEITLFQYLGFSARNWTHVPHEYPCVNCLMQFQLGEMCGMGII